MFFNNKRKRLSEINFDFTPTPPPMSVEFHVIRELLNQMETWRNARDKELEKQVWKMIAEKANLYSDGMKENYQSGSKLQTKEVVPVIEPCPASNHHIPGSTKSLPIT
jgi:hypothetical protein